MTDKMVEVYRVICEIISNKIAKNIHPTHALELEVRERCPNSNEIINQLIKDGHIIFGRTINQFYYLLKN